MQAQIIVADFPYSFSDKLAMSDVKRGALANYSTMSNKDLLALPIDQLADPEGCVFALWVPSSLLDFGLEVMEKNGFKLKTSYIWVKVKKQPILERVGFKSILDHFKKLDNWNWTIAGSTIKKFVDEFSLNNLLSFGMGHLFRNCHEIALIGINNNKIYKKLENRSQRTVSFEENLKHSAKPEHLQNSLDLMFPDPKLTRVELFARRSRKGWVCLGNESPLTYGESIEVSLNKLLKLKKNPLKITSEQWKELKA